ncbi:TetR/AcrR family transcriptional regulator [Intrasporangium calvum]|uniref:TetR/AcrR family transcriptional regulator n=1 Tax=Intrasporangium calvum TaxID=53358 RepID=A0ABT5GD92_9MICO|nr:TetR/AcrR family transcriptional regulator [Intrasporangium calvum]MDC5696208.1 TetR/AcrR family transcriptional regulator [Intrasporangium calvum]
MATKGELTKTRLVDSMLELIQSRGYAGTGLIAVAEHARAPKGSLYFHFPDGKEALGVAAVDRAADQFHELITAAARDEPTAGGVVRRVVEALAALLEASDFQLGCPVSVVTLEMGADSDLLRQSCAAAFESWISPVAELLVEHGRSDDDARGLATTLVSTVEGASIISRAQRSVVPLLRAGQVLSGLVDAR